MSDYEREHEIPRVDASKPSSNGTPLRDRTGGETAERTDIANGEAIIRLFGRDLLYCPALGGWYVWDGTRFAKDETGEAIRLAKATARKSYASAMKMLRKTSAEAEAELDAPTDDPLSGERKRRAAIASRRTAWAAKSQMAPRIQASLTMACSESGIPVTPDQVDRDPWLFNVLNGTLDLRTGALLPHDRSHQITKVASVSFDESARAPHWKAFLQRIFNGDEELVGWLQRYLGYALTGDVSEEIFVVFYGRGYNGKSTFVRAVARILGEFYRQIDPEVVLSSKVSSSKADIEKAHLRGRRLVMAAETGKARTLDDGLLKQVASNDRIIGKLLYADTIEFTPTHKFILMTNHKPVVKVTDEGTWRRILLVPFVVTIPKAERDRELDAKLAAEASGILGWMVEGCLAWQREGLDLATSIRTATAEYRADQDVLADFFGERCVIERDARVGATELYLAYKRWAEAGGAKRMSQKSFGEAVADNASRGIERYVSNGRKAYRGVRLRVGGDSGDGGDGAAGSPHE